MRSKPNVSVSISYASCTILASVPMHCPLCGTMTQPMVPHSCSKEEQPVKKAARKAR